MKKGTIFLFSAIILASVSIGLVYVKNENDKEHVKIEKREQTEKKEKNLASKKKHNRDKKQVKETAAKIDSTTNSNSVVKTETTKETTQQSQQTYTESQTNAQVVNEQQSTDPRTNDPKSQYYNATPEEMEKGRQMEQQAQDDYWAANPEGDNTNNEAISMDENTLTGFINKYGMTPAAYKMQVEGMSKEEALSSTPQNMKTSGEIQSEYQ